MSHPIDSTDMYRHGRRNANNRQNDPKIPHKGPKHRYVRACVAWYRHFWCLIQDEDNRKIVETAVSTFGGLHVSFINAGVLIPATLTDAPVITEEHIDGTFGPNFKGVVFGLKHQVRCIVGSREQG